MNTTGKTFATISEAQRIMGKNFLGIEEAAKLFGLESSIVITDRKLWEENEIPWSLDTLRAHKHTHKLVMEMPFSIMEILRDYTEYGSREEFEPWYENLDFAKDSPSLGWKLVRTTPFPKRMGKEWELQSHLVRKSKIEEVASAREIVYTMVSHFLQTGEKLFADAYFRCRDTVPSELPEEYDYGRIVVRYLNRGVCIERCLGDGPAGKIDIASVMKKNI